MKKVILILLACLWLPRLQASTFYEQLCQFNFNWAQHAERVPAGEARHFTCDREYIQAHLGAVLEVLHHNPVDELSDAQLQMRRFLLRELSAYREAGRFPKNYYRLGRVPVFIDEHDTHCAVGYLMWQSGHDDLARRIASADNYAWVKDIQEPGLAAWQQLSGFTVEELKLIQGAYDYYQPDALIAVNRYDIPQKPGVMNAHFGNLTAQLTEAALPLTIWCRGEGQNGVLNGRWVQNYRIGIPWIEGYYENGKRTGQWKEYYQGTRKLCRTEVWADDKLNGKRIRFDRTGRVIEEILFKDGKAVTKTNFDLETSLSYVRKPLDSTLVWTEVYNASGELIAKGHERVHNPGNLKWFQNIELTALNTIGLQSRDIVSGQQFPGGAGPEGNTVYMPSLYMSPPLVQYMKEGEWHYYKEMPAVTVVPGLSRNGQFWQHYPHYASELTLATAAFDDVACVGNIDSLSIEYVLAQPWSPELVFDNQSRFQIDLRAITQQAHRSSFRRFNNESPVGQSMVKEVRAYGAQDYLHYQIGFYGVDSVGTQMLTGIPIVHWYGTYSRKGERVGVWQYLTTDGTPYKREEYLIPWKERE